MAAKTFLLFLFLSFSLAISLAHAAKPDGQPFSRTLRPQKLGKEKLSHFRFYFHDTVSGSNPSAVRVAEAAATNASTTGFGLVAVMDNPLTVGPQLSSKLIGRAQGMYASASQTELSFLMLFNFAFTEGRNGVLSEVREMPVVGGSGLLRFARGYAQARTQERDVNTGDAVVEYNVYVFHY
ncbi:unnamed protein product [Linum tenue]|uniref:Dirigent protein n=1 Tax=Linum tenue TaxID=586396 RepID=A0AAV0IYY8_9ROSI|nr:unnamed protein product [Linum tenue]